MPIAAEESKAQPAPVQRGSSIFASAAPPSRQVKKAITGFFDSAVSCEFKQMALNQDKTVRALLTEAINDLLTKYGRNPIA